ncbi:Arm DNA-binding domain-containing protein [Lacticaseibacillus parakribbianus]|uniref:Arm DNA-binding domain-containing protein n=1 Tax=Lacticaseibacillus parakribbianus TaxID=2970927 RepID=UPI0021CAFDD6|nr:Arm DNA-binding domain-containing protein [Lacticaseibacillus parakribbianus]
MASITKYDTQKGTRWKIQVYAGVNHLTGKKLYRTRQGFRSQYEARLAATKLEFTIQNGDQLTKNKSRTIEQVINEYLEAWAPTVRPSTARAAAGRVKINVVDVIGDWQIEKADLQRYLNSTTDTLPSSFKGNWGFVRRVFRFTLDNAYIRVDPTIGVKLPRQEKAPIEDDSQYWTREQIDHFPV